MMKTGRSKKKQGENSYKDVKKEEETCESMGGLELEDLKKKTEESKTSKKKKIKSKKVVNAVETGESTGGVELKVRKKKAEVSKTSKKKKIKRKNVVNGIPEFTMTIKKSYLKFLVRLKPKTQQNSIHKVSLYRSCVNV